MSCDAICRVKPPSMVAERVGVVGEQIGVVGKERGGAVERARGLGMCGRAPGTCARASPTRRHCRVRSASLRRELLRHRLDLAARVTLCSRRPPFARAASGANASWFPSTDDTAAAPRWESRWRGSPRSTPPIARRSRAARRDALRLFERPLLELLLRLLVAIARHRAGGEIGVELAQLVAQESRHSSASRATPGALRAQQRDQHPRRGRWPPSRRR